MKKVVSILVILVMLFSLVACSGTTKTTGKEDGGAAGTASAPDNSGSAGSSGPVEITVALSVLPNGLDPISEDFPDTLCVCYLIYDRLVNFDEYNNFLPGIAKSWEQVDSVTWKFDINLDYVFQNGEKLTMGDLEYSLLRIKDIPKQADTGALIDSVTSDGNTLTIKFTEENNTLLSRVLTTCVIVNKAYIEANGDDAVYMKPIGTGPYKVTEFVPGTATAVASWEGYPFKKPQIDKIKFIGIMETAGRYIAVETGQAQFTGQLTPYEVDMAKEKPNLATFSMAATTITGFIFNCQRAPFDNVNVRRAITYAVDRASICALQGGRIQAKSFLFGGYKDWYVESAKMPEFDINKAKDLLEAEGYSASKPLSIEVTTYQTSEPGLELFQSTMRSIGVEVTLNIVEFSVYLATEANGNFDMLFTSLLNRGGHPLTDLNNVDEGMFGTRNLSYYSNPRVMEIVRRMRVSNDTQELKNLTVEINDILAEDVPMVAVLQFTLICAMDKNLTGVFINADGLTSFRDAVYTG